jgi:hypothetical protein
MALFALEDPLDHRAGDLPAEDAAVVRTFQTLKEPDHSPAISSFIGVEAIPRGVGYPGEDGSIQFQHHLEDHRLLYVDREQQEGLAGGSHIHHARDPETVDPQTAPRLLV